MLIRKLNESDIPELLELYKHYTVKENLPELPGNKISRIWQKIASNESVSYFVMEIDRTLVASCILSITPSFIRGGEAFGIIEHVVTHSDFRRRGFAKSLIEYSLQYAWDNNCTEVMLLSGVKNEHAHKLYEKTGFDQNRKKGFVLFRNRQ